VFVGMNALNGKAEVFGTNVEVSDYGYHPDVAVDSAGNIYVVFNGEIGVGSGILLKKSTDNGASFPSVVPISPGTNGDSGDDPSIAIDASGNIHVAYITETDYHIYYASSTNGRVSFTTPIKISDAAANCLYGPKIAAFGSTVYVVWACDDYEIYIDTSIAGGSFGTDVGITGTTSSVQASPSVAIDNDGNILVAWCGSSTGHVSFTKATPGSPFSAPVQVDDSTSGATYPSIDVDADGCIFVAWQDGRAGSGNADIYAAVSSDDGATFSPGVKVNADTTDTDQKMPSLAVHPCGKIFVAWGDERSGGSEIYFANSTDGGENFGTNVKVSDAAPATIPSLTVGDDTEVYIVWQGITIIGYGKIYFDQAPDATWPNAVDDLEVVGATGDSITLNWTAPGDNFALGTAATYDIRYSEATITEANWADATPVTANPPSAGGSTETFTVGSLNNDTTYYFALKTSDEMPNISPLSNVVSGKTLDEWAPDAVTDLVASDPTSNTITLKWTAPGDNGNTGTAAEYDIRYNTTEVNDTTWDDAIQCTLGDLVPSEAGATETFVVTGLEMTTTYYFALKTADETPNWSDISNPATNTTTANTPPVASNLVITPTAPKTTDDLVGSYDYSDAETDAESGTEIRWYKDDVLQTDYNDLLTIPSTATAKGEVWYFTVKPKDGTDFGDLVTSPNVTILNSAPVANFTISPAVPYYTDTEYTFTSTSTDPDGDTLTYLWDFGDGASSTEANQTHTYTTPGAVDVTLTVTDTYGAVANKTLSITLAIKNQPPVASNLTITPVAPKTTNNLVASYDYYDADNNTENGTEIRWYKDDVLQTDYNDLLTIPSTATAKGEVWYFTVKPKDGTAFGVLKTSANVTIQNSAPTASFTTSATEAEVGVEITFTSTSSDPDNDALTYLWDFGDNTTSIEVSPTHKYDKAGTYNVKLTVTDTSGASDTSSITEITVKEKPADIWIYVAVIVIIIIIVVAVAAVVMKKKKKPEAIPETEE